MPDVSLVVASLAAAFAAGAAVQALRESFRLRT